MYTLWINFDYHVDIIIDMVGHWLTQLVAIELWSKSISILGYS